MENFCKFLKQRTNIYGTSSLFLGFLYMCVWWKEVWQCNLIQHLCWLANNLHLDAHISNEWNIKFIACRFNFNYNTTRLNVLYKPHSYCLFSSVRISDSLCFSFQRTFPGIIQWLFHLHNVTFLNRKRWTNISQMPLHWPSTTMLKQKHFLLH